MSYIHTLPSNTSFAATGDDDMQFFTFIIKNRTPPCSNLHIARTLIEALIIIHFIYGQNIDEMNEVV